MRRQIIPSLIFICMITAASLRAQYSPDVAALRSAQELYDERGYQQGKALSVDGRVTVSEQNGNLSYVYPISKSSKNGYLIETSLSYCGSVAHTTFDRYVIARDGGDIAPTTPYEGWQKFHANKAVWIIGVNGFAVQVLSTASHFTRPPNRRAGDGSRTLFNDSDCVWLADGYDFSNRMIDYGADYSSEQIGETYVDNIRLLRADGSVLELMHATAKNNTNPDDRPEIYSGYYIPAAANSSAFAVVEFDSTYWWGLHRSQMLDVGEGSRSPLMPRVCRYYPGDGTCFTFREHIMPYGVSAYRFYDSATGGRYGGPTIFYLESISSAAGTMVTFHRSRHYPLWPETMIDDSSRGRALLLDFEGHTFSYGSNSMTIQAFGRTTTVKFAKVIPSGNATETTWMPIGRNGYFNYWAFLNSTLPEAEPFLYRSYQGYVTEIVDPVGRKTSFTYEPYVRKYINYGYPRYGDGSDVTLRLANLRLKTITEPTAKYTIYYYKKTPDLGASPELDGLYLSTSNDTLSIRAGDDQDTMAQKVTNIVAAIDKFDKQNVLLSTDRYRFQYENHTTFANEVMHLAIDQVTHDTVTTQFSYTRFWLPPLLRKVPTPRFTALTQTVTSAAGVTTVENVYYGAPAGTTSGVTAWGTTFQATPSATGTPFLILDTAKRITVNTIEKSYESISYTLDTARTYGGDTALTRLLGLDIKEQVTRILNPATHATRTAQTIEYQHLPYIDTVGNEVYAFLQKLVVWRRWDSLKTIGLFDPTIKWEEAMFDPRIALWNYDTVSTRVMVPPQYRLKRATVVRDGAGAVLRGTGRWLHTAFDPLWDSSYANRGLSLVDTVIGAGGSSRFVRERHDYVNRLPSLQVDANGSPKRLSYDHSFPEHPDVMAEDFPWPYGMLFDNRDSVHDYRLRSSVYGNFTEQPMAERSYVRRYDPSNNALDTSTLENRYERSYYGLVSGVIDPNGWYSRRDYDANGRVRHLWMPGDFQSPDSVYTIDYSGWDSSETNGTTSYRRFTNWVDCREPDPFNSPLVDTNVEVTIGGLYADYPIVDVPNCPECGGKTREKDAGRRAQGLCTTPIQYSGTTPAVGTASFGVVPPGADSMLSLDSAYLRFHISSIIGECITLKVTIPALDVTKYYLFNCGEDSYEGGGGGIGSETKEKGAGRSMQSGDTILAGIPTSMKIDLTSKKSAILAMGGGAISVTFEMTTPGGRVEFVSGFDAEDKRPRLMLKGSFRKVNHLADYTLAYSYNDADIIDVQSAKVDDIRHTANLYDSIAVGDRRATLTTYAFGTDWRLMRTERTIVEDSGAVERTDTSFYAYTGLAHKTKSTDPLGDTTVNRYDALGRLVETINADGTHSTVSYAIGTPTDFGITGQDFYGFVTAKTTTNENGIKFTQYTDAFDSLRREVADSGSTGSTSAHLNLTTRYEYDVEGRLTRAINPKGDTTKYAYDDFGRVKYKYQPDLGTVSFAYDNAGNVRFTQSQEQATRGRLTFNQYDDLKRVTIIGEAVLGGAAYNEDTMLVATGGSGSFPPTGRLTSSLDPTRLHTGASSSILTANRTMWMTPQVAVPAASSQFGIVNCTLPPNADLGETSAPVAPFLRRPASWWISNPPLLSCDTNSFEHIGQHPEFVRIAIAYDTLPESQGAIWQACPAMWQWDALAPHGVVRNQKGHEAAVAYRERGCEPFHYAVLSYDERGRVEALLRFTENLGFDAVYYTYNSMNKITSVRAVDPMRQYATWYGYDRGGRIDSVWSYLTGNGGGLVTFFGIKYVGPPSRPDTADIVYRYTKTGQLQTTQYPPVNVLVTYAYDHRKWLDSLVSTQNGAPLFREILSYDPTGQITKQVWRQGTGTRQQQTYTYDSVQRLIGWTLGPAGGSPTSTTGYSYDNAGNRLDVTSGSTTLEQYTIATGKNQLATHRTTPTIGFPIRSDYGYNGNGSMVERAQYEDHGLSLTWQQTENYGYGFRELLKRYKVATPGPMNTITTKDWRYRYSAGGEREQKRMYPSQWGDTDVIYPWQYYLLGISKEQLAVYHGQQLVNMYCPGDTGRRVYFYPSEYITNGVGYTGTPELLAQVITKPTGAKEYCVSDHLASLRVSVEGGTTHTLNYDPWGNPLSGSSTGERLTFNDQERDLENGLYDLSDRNYSPKVGSFTRPDRLWERYRSVSPYTYCSDNPARLTDPTGMQTQEYIMPEAPYTGMRAAEPTGSKKDFDNTFKSQGENMGSGGETGAIRRELQELSTKELQAEARGSSDVLNTIFKAAKNGEFTVPEGLTVRNLLVYEELARRCINHIGGLSDPQGVQAFRYKIIQVFLEFFKK